MAIQFKCPKCQSQRQVHERMAGRKVRCPSCSATIRIPEVVSAAVTPAPFEDFIRESTPALSSLSSPVSESKTAKGGTQQENDLDAEMVEMKFPRKELPKDDMDMTPMVDVTFLLLIFFMVTASFTTEKALQQQVASDQPSTQPKPEDETETIKILVDEFNAYTVIFPDGGENEATSKQELINILKMAELDGSSEDASNLVIDAHEDSIHAAVVGALDAGRQSKLTNFRVNVVESLD